MMGAQLVNKCYTFWTDLPDRPFRLLAYMSLVAKDTNAKPTFWGGRASLAGALGLDPENPSSARMVSRAIAHLVDVGAVARAYVGHHNKRSEYLLTLDKMPKKGDSAVTHKGDSGVRRRVTPESAKGDSGVTLRVTGESPLGTTEDEGRSTRGTSPSDTYSGVPRQTRPVRGKADEERLRLIRSRMDGEAAS